MSADDIDRKLWPGAAAAGWKVKFSGNSNYTYIAPDGRAKFSSANKVLKSERRWSRVEERRWKMCDGSVNRS